jgi:hypothetical protein
MGAPPKRSTSPVVWDTYPKPVYVEYKGQTIQAFRRGNLALALNRTVHTIRAMERKGVLSHPRVKDGRGHWLYTRDQIEDLVELAITENVIDPRYRNTFSQFFIEQAHQILQRLPRLN